MEHIEITNRAEVWRKFSCPKYVPGGRSWFVHKYQKELVCS